MTVLKQAARLSRNLKQTAGSRFIAAKRLEARDRALTRMAAFASAYVIILTILPYFIEIPKRDTDLINLFTVALALIVLVASLYQYSNGDIVNAEQHHRSGLELNEIRRDLELRDANITAPELAEFTQRYNLVLQKYSINHDNIDYLKLQLDRPEDYPWVKAPQRLQIWLLWNWKHHFPTLMLTLLSVGTGAMVAYHVYILPAIGS